MKDSESERVREWDAGVFIHGFSSPTCGGLPWRVLIFQVVSVCSSAACLCCFEMQRDKWLLPDMERLAEVHGAVQHCSAEVG